MAERYTITPVTQLRPGMLLDLEDDSVADPDGDSVELEYEYALVECVTQETSNCVRVDTEAGSWGFPVDHEVKVFDEE